MNQPLFAEVLASTIDSTHAVVWVFSKPILREFTGPGHHKKALEWVGSWQQHLDHQWAFIKDTFAKTMNEFASAISSHGVHNEIILKAQETIIRNSALHEQGIL